MFWRLNKSPSILTFRKSSKKYRSCSSVTVPTSSNTTEAISKILICGSVETFSVAPMWARENIMMLETAVLPLMRLEMVSVAFCHCADCIGGQLHPLVVIVFIEIEL